MTVVYCDTKTNKHVTITDVIKIEITINSEELMATYSAGPLHDKKYAFLKKDCIISIKPD
jgi:hypothetical protein